VPAWSPDVANEFIRLAAADNRAFDQIQLQKLIYIAHGWCLAISGEPLTGDRPEAWDFGPAYRRLADALSPCGLDPVTAPIADKSVEEERTLVRDYTNVDVLELDVITRIYHEYGGFTGSQLSNLTRRGSTPWHQVYADGSGRFREIPHKLIREQFVTLAEKQSSQTCHARS